MTKHIHRGVIGTVAPPAGVAYDPEARQVARHPSQQQSGQAALGAGD